MPRFVAGNQAVSLAMAGAATVLKGAVYIYRKCVPVYRRARDALHRAFCSDEFRERCYRGMDGYVASRGYKW